MFYSMMFIFNYMKMQSCIGERSCHVFSKIVLCIAVRSDSFFSLNILKNKFRICMFVTALPLFLLSNWKSAMSQPVCYNYFFQYDFFLKIIYVCICMHLQNFKRSWYLYVINYPAVSSKVEIRCAIVQGSAL